MELTTASIAVASTNWEMVGSYADWSAAAATTLAVCIALWVAHGEISLPQA